MTGRQAVEPLATVELEAATPITAPVLVGVAPQQP